MKQKIISSLVLSLLVLGAFIMQGCSSDEITISKQTLFITEVSLEGIESVEIDEWFGTISMSFPCGTDLTSLAPEFTITEGATITPASGTEQDFTNTVVYTVKKGNDSIVYKVSAGVTACVTGFLSYEPNRESIVDDDEAAAAAWFFDAFDETETKFVSFDDIKADPTVLDDITTLFWVLDGHPEDNSNWFPEIALDTDVLGAITNWYKNGGNLYLHQHAAHYIFDLGRMTVVNGFPEKMIGGGTGFENGDTWSIGINMGLKHDNSSHPMFSGIEILTYDNGQKAIPTIGAGWREDRNAMQNSIPGRYGLPNDAEEVFTKYTTENNLVWIGSWDGILDYWNGGVFEYLPTDEYKGRVISIGIGGVEWNVNANGERGAEATINPEGVNPYQDNVETMAFNIINYLSAN